LDVSEIQTVWDADFISINRYILGCYGATRTAGQDLIRLTDVAGNAINNIDGQDGGEEYTANGIFEHIPFASPEVFGGGQKGLMPVFPYYTEQNQTRQYLYGAPDGYNDGIIMIYMSEMDSGSGF